MRSQEVGQEVSQVVVRQRVAFGSPSAAILFQNSTY